MHDQSTLAVFRMWAKIKEMAMRFEGRIAHILFSGCKKSLFSEKTSILAPLPRA
jgi:hypothetical protein